MIIQKLNRPLDNREPEYAPAARENEEVFRNVLRDLRNNRDQRPGGIYVPEDLETEASLDNIFQKYSMGDRMYKFTIVEFSKPEKTRATINFKDIAPLSGGGAKLEYSVNEDNSVQYTKACFRMMS